MNTETRTRSGEEFGREEVEKGKDQIGEQRLGTVGIQRCMQSIAVNWEFWSRFNCSPPLEAWLESLKFLSIAQRHKKPGIMDSWSDVVPCRLHRFCKPNPRIMCRTRSHTRTQSRAVSNSHLEILACRRKSRRNRSAGRSSGSKLWRP